MLVKNTGKKCIGFGALVLLPDAVDTLPDGYGPEHPVVKFFISKKWLTVIKGKTAPAPADPPPQNPPPVDPFSVPTEEEAEAARKAGIAAKIKEVGKMNLEPLRVEATALGIEWTAADTKAVLAKKITEKLTAEMG